MPPGAQRLPGLGRARPRTRRRRASAAIRRPSGSRTPSRPSSSMPTGIARSTAAAPPSWSAWAWVTTSRSSRRTPACAQARDDAAVRRPGVDEHRVAPVLDERRVALADVEERDAQAGGRRERPRARRARHHARARAAADRGGAARARRAAARGRRAIASDGAEARRAPTTHGGTRDRRVRAAAPPSSPTHATKASGYAGERGERRAPPRALTCPTAAAAIPSHITGATAGAASTLAGSETSDVRLEVQRDAAARCRASPRR